MLNSSYSRSCDSRQVTPLNIALSFSYCREVRYLSVAQSIHLIDELRRSLQRGLHGPSLSGDALGKRRKTGD